MIYCVGSRTSPYCIRPRMVRSRMRLGLLPLMLLRLRRVLVLSRIMPFSFGTHRLHSLATTSVFHMFLESNQLFIRNQT